MNQHILSYPDRLGLAARLIVPVQRGPRYKLLISEIQKIDQHLDDENCSEAVQVGEIINRQISVINSALSSTSVKKPSPSESRPTQTWASWWENYQFGDITRGVIAGISNALADDSEANEKIASNRTG